MVTSIDKELSVPFRGRSYEEMVMTLDDNECYPNVLCASCGRDHIPFDALKACPYCGGQ